MSADSDILVEISDHDLPQLVALYKDQSLWVPYVAGLVRTAMRWRKLEGHRDAIKFYSPNNCWKTDGTVIVIITFNCVDVFVFTLDEQCTNLYKGLTETKVLNIETSHILFYGVHERFVPTVRRSILDTNRKIIYDTPCYLYTISPEEAKQFKVDCPADVYVKKLDSSAAPWINKTWPHRFEGSEAYLAKFLEANGGYGVFLKSSNEMVACVLRLAIGNMSQLYTADGYRKKGYASLVVQVLGKEIAEEGLWPVATILTDNQQSLQMFEKLRFRSVGKTNFIVTK